MLGDGVLLAPVMTAGRDVAPVYLPAGRWYPVGRRRGDRRAARR